MGTYEYGRIAKLAEQLEAAGIAPDVTAQIMQGGEAIRKAATPQAKAAWMREAMLRMNKLLDKETRQAVREGCACCLGGKRLDLVKAIARKGGSLEERVAAANQTKMVFGHSVTLQDDGQVLVCFSPEGQEHYRCVCLPKAQEALPITYCYCCGGHVKHHLQTALGRNLVCTVRSSALSSAGQKPCTFVFALQDEAQA
jgi:hypothetical protein